MYRYLGNNYRYLLGIYGVGTGTSSYVILPRT